jgi:hypothetical protein
VLYFFINIPVNEIFQLENKLPKGCYCFFQVQAGSTRYYGMIKKDAFALLKESLSHETVQNLELLDKNVFQLFFLQNISDNITCLGNRRLMIHLSADNT